MSNVSTQARPDGMAGLAKGLKILELFGPANTRITVTSAAQHTGITRAAARRCLLTLTALNYVNHDGKYFTPAPRLLQLGSAYLGGDGLALAAAPVLDRLRDEIGESVSLGVVDGDDIRFIARSTAAHVVSAAIQIGARWPLYCTAAGRVVLAAWPRAQLDAYLARCLFTKFTGRTLTDAEAVRREIEETQRRGYSESDEELEIGLRAVAVPVRSGAGDVVAALAVSASSARITIAGMERDIVPALHRAASLMLRGGA